MRFGIHAGPQDTTIDELRRLWRFADERGYFCALFRPPGVLAKAAVSIDHVSGGRCELGIGAGWNQAEFDAFHMPFLPIKDRLDQVEEAAIVLRRLFDGERVTLDGKQIKVTNAICAPRPVQQ